MNELIKKAMLISSVAKEICSTVVAPFKRFPGSEDYWKQRYKSGGTSGAGSYGRLAQFKADIINTFVKEKQISTVIEYGCGDGNQLKLADYPSYIGFDVSRDAISLCQNTFSSDGNKVFKLVDAYTNEDAQEQLFDSSTRFVIIYSSDTDQQVKMQAAHVKHRKFTKWIEANRPEWSLLQQIPNKYPYRKDDKVESFADFYVYEKI